MSAHCRIARVRLKASPHLTVHRMPPKLDLRADFTDDCASASISTVGAMLGYAVVIWGDDGSTVTITKNSDQSPYHMSMIPSLVEGAIRRHEMYDIAVQVLEPNGA